MTKAVLVCASLIALSSLANAQEMDARFRGEALRLSGDTLHCTKCVLTLNQKDKVQVIAAGFTTGRIGGNTASTMTFHGTVRLKLVDGEVVAKGGMLRTDSNGAGKFSSDELQFVRSSPR